MRSPCYFYYWICTFDQTETGIISLRNAIIFLNSVFSSSKWFLGPQERPRGQKVEAFKRLLMGIAVKIVVFSSIWYKFGICELNSRILIEINDDLSCCDRKYRQVYFNRNICDFSFIWIFFKFNIKITSFLKY